MPRLQLCSEFHQLKGKKFFWKSRTTNAAKQEAGCCLHHLRMNYVSSPCEMRAMTGDAGAVKHEA